MDAQGGKKSQSLLLSEIEYFLPHGGGVMIVPSHGSELVAENGVKHRTDGYAEVDEDAKEVPDYGFDFVHSITLSTAKKKKAAVVITVLATADQIRIFWEKSCINSILTFWGTECNSSCRERKDWFIAFLCA